MRVLTASTSYFLQSAVSSAMRKVIVNRPPVRYRRHCLGETFMASPDIGAAVDRLLGRC